MRSTMLIVNSPMIAVGSPMKITASAAPITIVYMSIPNFTFLALHPGSLSSKNRAQAGACDIGRIARDSLMGAHEGTGMSAPRCFAPIDVRRNVHGEHPEQEARKDVQNGTARGRTMNEVAGRENCCPYDKDADHVRGECIQGFYRQSLSIPCELGRLKNHIRTIGLE
jgi:hypothetical protein